MNINNYWNEKKWDKILNLKDKYETPFLLLDIDKVGKIYKKYEKAFDYANIYYAIKANPDEKVLKELIKKGSNFDVASINEIEKILSMGVEPSKLSYGNTIKKEKDIKKAYEKGVRIFVTDSESDIRKLSRKAPGSKVFFRLKINNKLGSKYPLNKKFGCNKKRVVKLLKLVDKSNLIAYGVSFHVGSQQENSNAWEKPIKEVAEIFNILNKEGINLKLLNIGGGFPAIYTDKVDGVILYSKKIKGTIDKYFKNKKIKIMMEPGRAIVANAGIIVSEVISRKYNELYDEKWVFLDIGRFNGISSEIKLPIYTFKKSDENEVILAGPTCDSADIFGIKNKYLISNNIKAKDKIMLLSTGAYSVSVSSVFYNGFLPLKVYYMN